MTRYVERTAHVIDDEREAAETRGWAQGIEVAAECCRDHDYGAYINPGSAEATANNILAAIRPCVVHGHHFCQARQDK